MGNVKQEARIAAQRAWPTLSSSGPARGDRLGPGGLRGALGDLKGTQYAGTESHGGPEVGECRTRGRVWILSQEKCIGAQRTLRRVTVVAGQRDVNEDRRRLDGQFRCLWRASCVQALGSMSNNREGGKGPHSLFILPAGSRRDMLAGGEMGSGGWGTPGAGLGWGGLLMNLAPNCLANHPTHSSLHDRFPSLTRISWKHAPMSSKKPGTPFYRWGQASPNTQQGKWQLGLCPAGSPPLRLCLLWSQDCLESHKSQRSEDKAHLSFTLLRTHAAATHLPFAVRNFSQKQNTGQEEPPGNLSASIVLP